MTVKSTAHLSHSFLAATSRALRRQVFRSTPGLLSTDTTTRTLQLSVSLPSGKQDLLCLARCTALSNQDTQRPLYSVVSFYHLTPVHDPARVTEEHRRWLLAHGLRGRVYVSAQGINAQCSGKAAKAEAYAVWTAEQAPFKGLTWVTEPCRGHVFPRLRVKHRALVHLAGGTDHLQVTSPQARAVPLAPAEWRAMLQAAPPSTHTNVAESTSASSPEAHPVHPIREPALENAVASRGAGACQPHGLLTGSESGHSTAGALQPVLLDVRNGYEWDVGHFRGAARPSEDAFNQTPTDAALSHTLPSELQGLGPDVPIMMYCTGGIRCDIYSTYLRQAGYNNLFSLQGGIQNYLRKEGPAGWKGSLFVFDDRLAVPAGHVEARSSATPTPLAAAAPCEGCGGEAVLPHINCRNLDCNALVMFCAACKDQWEGCCCHDCTQAPRILGSHSLSHPGSASQPARHFFPCKRTPSQRSPRGPQTGQAHRKGLRHVSLGSEPSGGLQDKGGPQSEQALDMGERHVPERSDIIRGMQDSEAEELSAASIGGTSSPHAGQLEGGREQGAHRAMQEGPASAGVAGREQLVGRGLPGGEGVWRRRDGPGTTAQMRQERRAST